MPVAPSPPETPDADFFRAIEARRTQALVTRDLALARRLHAPHYQLITPAGKPFGRDDYLAAIESGALPYVKWEADTMDVRVGPAMAIVRYRARLAFASGRVTHCWHTDSWELLADGWQAVWSQATAIV